MPETLTDKRLQKAKPAEPGKRYTLWDAIVPGMGARVTDRGKVSFVVMKRLAGREKPTRITLGRYPALGLAQAREKARGALELVEKGKDPRAEVARQRFAERQEQATTFETVAKQFKALHLDKLRSGDEVWRAIERELIPEWGNRALREITRQDVFQAINRLEDAGTPYARNRRLAAIRKLFNWCVDHRGLLDANPAARIKALPETKRQRVLSDDEIRSFWQATHTLPYPAGPFLRLLLILGQRREQVSGIRKSEIDKDAKVWLIPPERTKNKLPHAVPLPDIALAEIEAMPKFKGDCLLTTRGGKVSIGNFSDIKATLDVKFETEAPYVLHDLRRTFRTRLSKIGVDGEIAERLIGHLPVGVRMVYDVHTFADEKVAAMNKWALHLQEIITPPTKDDKVVAFRERKK
jgi:integrase